MKRPAILTILSDFDLCTTEWVPEEYSPAYLRRRSWALGVPMRELVRVFDVEHLVDMALMTGGYEVPVPKYHWNRTASCPTIRNPKKSREVVGRIVSTTTFEATALESRCQVCNGRFNAFKKA
jgi:hypothetical protein